MNFLLDTHVWIWSVSVTSNLSLASQATLANPQHKFFLSPISIWETLLLIEKKRLPINIPPQLWVEYALQISAIQEAPLTHAIARRCRQLQLPQQDPADRFIAATALEYDLTLMTADGHLLQSTELTTWSVV